MGKVVITKEKIDVLADSISEKTGVNTPMTLSEMKEAVDKISGSGGIKPSGIIQISKNNSYNVSLYETATVNVTPSLQTKVITPNKTLQHITPEDNYQGFSSIDIEPIPNDYILPIGATAQPKDVSYGKTFYGSDGILETGISTSGGGGAISDVVETLPGGGVHHIITGTGGYDINSGDLFSLFDQYVFENEMIKQDLSFAEDQTDYVTITHNLGRVPVEALLYPKNPKADTNGYQIGWTKGLFGMDNTGNRTYKIMINYPPSSTADVYYGTGKTLLALISTIQKTDYNFSRNPTSTTVDIRGGTNNLTKLLAGEYILALK